jgi:sarcosine oxidase, subunit gamma
MPDQRATRQSPLERLTSTGGTVSALAPLVRLVFRGRISTIGRVTSAFGVEPAMEACRAAVTSGRAALWLGPDEWLLIAEDGEPHLIFDSLEAALKPLAFSLVDVSHRQTGLRLEGPHAATILNAGCPLDLEARVFPTGMCTRTILGKAEIVLWRTDVTIFRIEVARSLASYVWQFLEQAERDF